MNNRQPTHITPATPETGPSPETTPSRASPGLERYALVILAVVSAGMILVALNNKDLWNPDEPRYAQVAREMVQGDEYILLRLNGEKYPDKPPLYFWLVILCSKLTGGINEVSARMPSALAGVGVVLMTFALGRRLFGVRAGFIAGLVLLSSVYFLFTARSVHMDLPLTFIVMAMIYTFYHAWERGGAEWWTWPAFFFLGALGVMMKGPVGLLLPLFVCLLFSLLRRDWRAWHWSTALGAVVLVAILSAWLLLLWQRGGNEHIMETLFGQNIGRATGEASHESPLYYYFWMFPLLFLPWSLLFVAALVTALARCWGREVASGRILLAVVWFAVIFVFFTAIPSRRDLYMLPLFPAAAILVGWLLDSLIRDVASRRAGDAARWLMSAPLVLTAAAAALALLALAWVRVVGDNRTTDLIDTVKHNYPVMIVLSVLLSMQGMMGASAAFRKYWAGATTAMILMGLTLGFATVFMSLPLADGFKSARGFSVELNERVGDSEVVWYGDLHEGVVYYSGRRFRVLSEPEDVAEYFSGKSARVKYCAMRKKYYDQIKKACRERGTEISAPILEEAVGSKRLILIRTP